MNLFSPMNMGVWFAATTCKHVLALGMVAMTEIIENHRFVDTF